MFLFVMSAIDFVTFEAGVVLDSDPYRKHIAITFNKFVTLNPESLVKILS